MNNKLGINFGNIDPSLVKLAQKSISNDKKITEPEKKELFDQASKDGLNEDESLFLAALENASNFKKVLDLKPSEIDPVTEKFKFKDKEVSFENDLQEFVDYLSDSEIETNDKNKLIEFFKLDSEGNLNISQKDLKKLSRKYSDPKFDAFLEKTFGKSMVDFSNKAGRKDIFSAKVSNSDSHLSISVDGQSVSNINKSDATVIVNDGEMLLSTSNEQESVVKNKLSQSGDLKDLLDGSEYLKLNESFKSFGSGLDQSGEIYQNQLSVLKNDITDKVNNLDLNDPKIIVEATKILDLEINQPETKLAVDNKLSELITEDFIVNTSPNDLKALINKLGPDAKSSKKINSLSEKIISKGNLSTKDLQVISSLVKLPISNIDQVFSKVNSEVDGIMAGNDIEKGKVLLSFTQGIEGQGLGENLKTDSKTIDAKFEITLTKAKEQLTNHLNFVLLAEMEQDPVKKAKLTSEAQSIFDDYNINRDNVTDKGNQLKAIESKIFPPGTGELNIVEASKFLLGGEKNYKLASANAKLQENLVNTAKKLDEGNYSNDVDKQNLELDMVVSQSQIKINAQQINGRQPNYNDLVFTRDAAEIQKGINSGNTKDIKPILNRYLHNGDVNKHAKLDQKSFLYSASASIAQQEGNIPKAIESYEKLSAITTDPKEKESLRKAIASLQLQNGDFSKLGGLKNQLAFREFEISSQVEMKEKIVVARDNTYVAPKVIIDPQFKSDLPKPEGYSVNSLIKDDPEVNRLKSLIAKEEKILASNINKVKNELTGSDRDRYLIQINMKTGNTSEAIKHIDNLINVETDVKAKSELLLQKASLQISISDSASYSIDQAIKLIEPELNGKDPEGSLTLYTQALMLKTSTFEDPKDAIPVYDKVIKTIDSSGLKNTVIGNNGSQDVTLNDIAANATLSKGNAYLMSGDADKGVAVLKAGSKKYANNSEFVSMSTFMQAEMDMFQDKPEDAFNKFNTIIKEYPDSPAAKNIKNLYGEHMENGKLPTNKSDFSAALQVALKESGSNSIYVSGGLVAGGAATGAAIGVWFFGVGAAPGALIGAGVGALIDRVSGTIGGADEISQAYNTGYEDISASENVMNVVFLALDFVEVGAVVKFASKASSNFIGKAGRMAFSKTDNLTWKGMKDIGSESMQLGRKGVADYANTINKFAKAQVGIGLGAVLGPGAYQAGSAVVEYSQSEGTEEDWEKFKGEMATAGSNTLKNVTSMVGMMTVMGLTNKGVSQMDKMITNLEFKNAAIGNQLGAGKGKSVHTIKGYDDKVIGIQHKDMGKSFDQIDLELKTLDEIKELGLPVTEIYAKTTHNGQPAVIMKKYELGSREVVSGGLKPKPRKNAFNEHLNETSIKDLENIKQTLIDKKIHIEDLQFLISKDGHVVIADPLRVHKGVEPSARGLETIDALIAVAKKKSPTDPIVNVKKVDEPKVKVDEPVKPKVEVEDAKIKLDETTKKKVEIEDPKSTSEHKTIKDVPEGREAIHLELAQKSQEVRTNDLGDKPFGKGNVAAGKLSLDNGTVINQQATSRSKGPLKNIPVPKSDGGHFEPSVHTPPDGSKGRVMKTDSEYKLYDDYATQLMKLDEADRVGKLDIFTEHSMCQSCSKVAKQFEAMFPGIELNVSYKAKFDR